MRSALPVLEEVELIRRHTDLPRRIAVYPEQMPLDDEPAPDWDRLASAIGGGGEWDPAELADAAGLPLHELEETILRCQEAGHVTYRSLGGRDPLFELLPPPPNAKARMEAMLRDRAEGAETKAQAMVAYAKERKCRHGQIARYFGDRWPNLPCGRCDVCAPQLAAVTASTTPENTAEHDPDVSPVLAALTIVSDLTNSRSPFALGRAGLVRTLRGTPDAPIRPERSTAFGALASFKKAEIERLVDALVEQGYLERDDSDEYRRLHLTAQGREAVRDGSCDMEWRVAKSPAPRPKRVGTEGGADDEGIALDAPDEELVSALRDWRRERAQSENVPPYVVFADKVLTAIAASKPANEFDLLAISGIGPAKAGKYGEAVLDLVRKHGS